MARAPMGIPALKRILAIDVGGSRVKLLATGQTTPRKFASGAGLTPERMVERAKQAAKGWRYDAVSIGVPALVGPAGLLAEPGNLGRGWVGFDFAAAFGCPVRMANDAAMQALGSYDGGRMLFVGLGTGLGSALIAEHVIVPLELGDLPFKRATLSARLGRAGLEKRGKRSWRKLLLKTVPALQKAFLVDYVVVGGGNAKHLPKILPAGVRVGNNLTAFRGGFRLWGIEEIHTQHKGKTERPAIDGEWRVV